ncbi:DUF3306 domain-containing protein [Methylobacterium sp. 17Sr1-1]|uniref:DUF3306 domain-containing protein n=1 Tax=Methylobacterium sp. 17Sr1-1 TaxID=2202826 RepID=UPI000D6F7009|nr:DUF3306 domain-containing protein [Methylobacterium sp. 17Sr1-1]AWN54957.1 DUF3306 domain-containing protein [Methylobacterium sp. 17Sr1-1]
MSDGFLARWSRRKRDEARRPLEATTEAESAEPAVAPPEDEAGLTPDELAQLPSLDALTAATDLTPFLRAGVPRALRNAALRRMWSIDPAIRDFVSEAREYAYDWNTPGGVPGTGGLISAEEVRAVVERVFGGGEEKPSVVDDEGVSAGSPPLPSGRGVGGEGGALPCNAESVVRVAQPSRIIAETEPPPRDLRSPLPLSQTGEGIPRPSLDQSALPDRRDPAPEPEPPPSPPRLRRHGGAIPI